MHNIFTQHNNMKYKKREEIVNFLIENIQEVLQCH